MTYKTMKKAELVSVCKERGLETNGNMETLKARLIEFDQKQAEKDGAGIGVGANSKKTYAVNAMRPALVAANKTGNRRAITVQDAHDAGVDEERLEQWVDWTENLWTITCDYVTVKRNRKSAEPERAAARQKIYPAWRTMLKAGEENIFSPKMYLREDDVESLVGFCEDFVATAHGTEQVCATKNKFRKLVETLIGCRIKGCETLPLADRDTVLKYEGAIRSKKKAEEALNGDANNKNKGIYADLKAIRKAKKELTEMLKGLGATEEAIAKATKSLKATETELVAAKDRSEKALSTAKKNIADLKEAAEAIYLRIDAVAKA